MELWELGTGRRLRAWPTPERAMVAALSPDGGRALIGDDEGEVALWDMPVPGPAAPWSYPLPREAADRLHEDEEVDRALGRTAELIAEGRSAAAADEIRRARAVPGYRRHRVLLDRWQDVARTGRRAALSDAWARDAPSIVGGFRVPPVTSRDGSLVLTGAEDGTVLVWDLARGTRRHALPGHDGRVHSLALCGDGPIALSGGEDGTARVWDVESGRCLHVLDGHGGEVDVAVSADGRVGVSGGGNRDIRVWNLETAEPLAEVTGRRTTHALRILLNADGSRIVSAAPAHWAPHIWEARTGRLLHVLPRDLGGGLVAQTLTLSRDSDVLLSGHMDGTVRVWDVRTAETLHTMSGHDEPVREVAVSADGTTAISLSEDSTIRVWDLRSGEGRRAVGDVGVDAWSVVVSDDGRFAVTDGVDDQVRVWDTGDGECLRVLGRHNASVEALALSANGRIVVSLDHNGVARVWELDWEFDLSQ
ncbi:WD40 repeat domain-containing protein [Actinomadura sp. 9N215]|uniref:WD40 repeat domain-containing protein n=1 Tax=Actinomadura sp. 9N215 TaxID=3375150 RepID=UPI00379350FD